MHYILAQDLPLTKQNVTKLPISYELVMIFDIPI